MVEAAKRFGDAPLDMLINIAGTRSIMKWYLFKLNLTLSERTGVGPEPDNWYEHTAEILKDKFAINTVVSGSHN